MTLCKQNSFNKSLKFEYVQIAFESQNPVIDLSSNPQITFEGVLRNSAIKAHLDKSCQNSSNIPNRHFICSDATNNYK